MKIMNHFDIDENKEYTFTEAIHIMSRALKGMAFAQQNLAGEDGISLTFDAKGLEGMIDGLILFMNNNMLGTFKLVQTEKGFYRIQYISEGVLN